MMDWKQKLRDKWEGANIVDSDEYMGIALSTNAMNEILKDIDALLASQRSQLVEGVSGLYLEPTLCGNCELNGPLCRECYANRRANARLGAAILLINPTSHGA